MKDYFICQSFLIECHLLFRGMSKAVVFEQVLYLESRVVFPVDIFGLVNYLLVDIQLTCIKWQFQDIVLTICCT